MAEHLTPWTEDPASFSSAQLTRLALMARIAQQLTSRDALGLTLKGGTALVFGYGMPRYSTDLDFDGKDPSVETVTAISEAVTKAGLTNPAVNIKKDTQTTRRHMVHHPDIGVDPLKIEISYRRADQVSMDTKTINGIRVYDLAALAHLKTLAFLGRAVGRDVWDIGYLLRQHGSLIADNDLQLVAGRLSELGLDYLASLVAEDDLLSSSDAEHVVLSLSENLYDLLSKRGLAPTA